MWAEVLASAGGVIFSVISYKVAWNAGVQSARNDLCKEICRLESVKDERTELVDRMYKMLDEIDETTKNN
tara:strand:+ start:368 stop:577 length:210 start_codon:yes stop_codon:yes gene_type:complete